MRLSLRFLVILIPVLAVVVFAFNRVLENLEHRWSQTDLLNRGELVLQVLKDPVLDSLDNGGFAGLKRVYRRLETNNSFKNVLGVVLCSLDGKIISRSPKAPKEVVCDWNPKRDRLDQLGKESVFFDLDEQTFHRSNFLIREETEAPQKEEKIEVLKPLLVESDEPRLPEARAYVSIIQDPEYRIERSETVRAYSVYAFLLLGFVVSLVTLLVYRWSLSQPVDQVTEVMKGMLTGDTERLSRALESKDLAPFIKDMDGVLFEMNRTKLARMNQSEADDSLAQMVNGEFNDAFSESRLCVIACEEPYIHFRRGTKVESRAPASGSVAAIEPIVRACSGIWFGHGHGVADHGTVDKQGMILVPPQKPEFALKRIWLTHEEEQGFYYGFSNEGLWPLCHIAHERPVFRHEDWEQYVEVNTKFASSFAEEVNSTRPITFVQDYHFALVPSMIRQMRPDALVHLFWHIPWPSPDVIRICPWRKELLLGMLGADLIGFQSQSHANNFLDTVERFLEARVSRVHFSVTIQGHTSYVKPFPSSVMFPNEFDVSAAEVREIKKKVYDDLGLSPKTVMGVAVDRMDYTKGILERFQAIERFLEKNPSWLGKFVFVQIASPSRTHLKRYQELNSEIQKAADRINWKYYSEECPPIVLKVEHHSKEKVYEHYRAADFVFVNSLHDGMNIVAKEFVASRSDEAGVLILSQFTGSAPEFKKDALLVNPYDFEECSEAILTALQMKEEEQKRRMKAMRSVLQDRTVYHWGRKILRELKVISDRKLEIEEDGESS